MDKLSWEAIAATWSLVVGWSFGVMKTTDLVRTWCREHLSIMLPDWTWIAVPFAVGVFSALQTKFNAVSTLVPTIAPLTGRILTGLAAGAIASPLHHGTALIAAKSKAVPVGGPVAPYLGAIDDEPTITE